MVLGLLPWHSRSTTGYPDRSGAWGAWWALSTPSGWTVGRKPFHEIDTISRVERCWVFETVTIPNRDLPTLSFQRTVLVTFEPDPPPGAFAAPMSDVGGTDACCDTSVATPNVAPVADTLRITIPAATAAAIRVRCLLIGRLLSHQVGQQRGSGVTGAPERRESKREADHPGLGGSPADDAPHYEAPDSHQRQHPEHQVQHRGGVGCHRQLGRIHEDGRPRRRDGRVALKEGVDVHGAAGLQALALGRDQHQPRLTGLERRRRRVALASDVFDQIGELALAGDDANRVSRLQVGDIRERTAVRHAASGDDGRPHLAGQDRVPLMAGSGLQVRSRGSFDDDLTEADVADVEDRHRLAGLDRIDAEGSSGCRELGAELGGQHVPRTALVERAQNPEGVYQGT